MSTTTMGMVHLYATGAITPTLLMAARPTDITVRVGLPAAFSLERAPGTAGTAASTTTDMVMVAADITAMVITTAMMATVAEAMTTVAGMAVEMGGDRATVAETVTLRGAIIAVDILNLRAQPVCRTFLTAVQWADMGGAP